MLTKCICTYCAGHLEFEEENAGEKIKCPHCGFETTLFLPGQEPDEEENEEAKSPAWPMKRPLIIIGAVVLALGGAVYSLRRWVLPPLKDWLPYTESPVLPVVALGIGCLGVLLLVAWTVFPVLIFLQFKKITSALQGIESNFRPVLSAEPVIAEDAVEQKANSTSRGGDRAGVLKESEIAQPRHEV
jgi:NADH:ubiquinone oxidoreductase subunit 5 (subunit L)/multisubunit Na+/H+ antiporter MnhA subunit